LKALKVILKKIILIEWVCGEKPQLQATSDKLLDSSFKFPVKRERRI
jgi:hypothetical protein